MYKVGLCGHFGFGKELVNGQTDKTTAVWRALTKALGEERVFALDTYGWKKNPVALFINCYMLLRDCENVIMFPAQGGIKVFPALFEFLNIRFKRKLHYVVVGGWLTYMLENSPELKKPLKKLDCIYVELLPMKSALEEMGFTNIKFKPKFRELNALKPDELYFPDSMPYRLSTFSRISLEKGIEDAVEAVRYVNAKYGRTVYTLDIYGKVDEGYKARFEEFKKSFEPFISYKGFVLGSTKSSAELKTCFALLFPTRYSGEGFAGTIVDAFSAGVPVIATDWKYNPIVIRNGVDGILYQTGDNTRLKEILIEAYENPQLLNGMRHNCLGRTAEFDPEKAVNVILDELV